MMSAISMRMFLLQKMKMSWRIIRIDEKEVFFNANLDEKIDVKVPDGFVMGMNRFLQNKGGIAKVESSNCGIDLKELLRLRIWEKQMMRGGKSRLIGRLLRAL